MAGAPGSDPLVRMVMHGIAHGVGELLALPHVSLAEIALDAILAPACAQRSRSWRKRGVRQTHLNKQAWFRGAGSYKGQSAAIETSKQRSDERWRTRRAGTRHTPYLDSGTNLVAVKQLNRRPWGNLRAARAGRKWFTCRRRPRRPLPQASKSCPLWWPCW